MNKSWKYLMIMAVVTLIAYIGFQVYMSVTGQNVTFTKTVTPIGPDLGQVVLEAIEAKSQAIQVRDESLDNK